MNLVHISPRSRFGARLAVPVAVAVLLAACVAPPPRVVRVPGPPPPPPQRVFVYPANGQSPEQTERDRYECHVWAVQQTGVDPSRADASAYERVVVQPANPPGSGTVAGLIGGATCAVIGSAADANAQAQAQQTQQQINESAAAGRARADSYRRAIGACLQGRGYTVT